MAKEKYFKERPRPLDKAYDTSKSEGKGPVNRHQKDLSKGTTRHPIFDVGLVHLYAFMIWTILFLLLSGVDLRTTFNDIGKPLLTTFAQRAASKCQARN